MSPRTDGTRKHLTIITGGGITDYHGFDMSKAGGQEGGSDE